MTAALPNCPDATLLMSQAADGDRVAADRLLPLVYEQLRKAAQLELAAELKDQTLSATALVHEAHVKLVGPRAIGWANRRHFYVAAANAMRQFLLDHARARGRDKRGGARRKDSLSVAATVKVNSLPSGPSQRCMRVYGDDAITGVPADVRRASRALIRPPRSPLATSGGCTRGMIVN